MTEEREQELLSRVAALEAIVRLQMMTFNTMLKNKQSNGPTPFYDIIESMAKITAESDPGAAKIIQDVVTSLRPSAEQPKEK